MKPVAKAKMKEKQAAPKEKRTLMVGPYEAEKHLRQFCETTSQELGNALGIVVGELDSALSLLKSDSQKDTIRVAYQAAEEAVRLARNLRYFAVHTRLDTHVVDISQVLLDSVDLMEREFESRKIETEIFVEDSTYVNIDPSAIQQVILNLFSHAFSAMPQGGKLSLSLHQKEDSIEVLFSDTGHGIRPEDKDELFEPNFVSRSGGHSAQRRGLELAVSKALIEAHGGELTVNSRAEKGSTLTVHLPFQPGAAKPSLFLEKRRFRRVQLNLPAEITFDGRTTHGHLIVLSIGGAFLALPEMKSEAFPDSKCQVSIKISYFNAGVVQIPQAIVINRVFQGPEAGIGVNFTKLDPKSKKILSALIRSHST